MNRKFVISVLVLATLVATFGFAAPVRADSLSGPPPGLSFTVALKTDELKRIRASGPGASAQRQTGEGRLGVILWDEFKPRTITDSATLGGSGGGGLTSLITGATK